jgi:hypothetical protein
MSLVTQFVSKRRGRAMRGPEPVAGVRIRRRSIATAAAATVLALASIALAPAVIANDRHDNDHWVGTWSASPQAVAAPIQINGQTVRQIVHTSLGGKRVRVRLSNAYGTSALVIGSAHVAVSTDGASISRRTDSGTARLAVLNAGISGNRVLHDLAGTNALARLDRDVLVQTGVKYVIAMEGNNDFGIPGLIGNPAEDVTAEPDIVAAPGSSHATGAHPRRIRRLTSPNRTRTRVRIPRWRLARGCYRCTRRPNPALAARQQMLCAYSIMSERPRVQRRDKRR